MKKIYGVLLGATLAFSVFSVAAIGISSKNAQEVRVDAIEAGMLYVGGVDITSNEEQKVSGGDGYVQLVGSTLIFHNYTYEGIGYKDTNNDHFGIYYDAPSVGSLNFVIEGQNTITIPSSNEGNVYGFYVLENKDDSFSFTGDGSLTINVNGATMSSKRCYGMMFHNKDPWYGRTTGKITFDGPSLTVNDINTSGGETYAINLEQGIANIPFEMKSGSIDIRSEGKAGGWNYAFLLRDFMMEDGSINVQATNGKWVYGLWFDNQGDHIGATIDIKGGSVNVEAQSSESESIVYGFKIGCDNNHKSYLNIGDEDHVEKVTISGSTSAINSNDPEYVYVTNKLAGKGYSDVAGTEDEEVIPVQTEEYQFPTSYKCVKFISRPKAVITEAPKAVEGLQYTGEELNLVTPGTASGGTLVYSLNAESGFTSTIPTAKEVGTYDVYYKVQGDADHKDSDVGHLSVTIATAPIDPDTPTSSGLPGWGVALIVVGSVIGLLGICFLVLFFLLNKWIKEGDKAVRVMRFALGSKDGKQRYLAFPCKFAYRNKEEVFNTKQDALK